jgi:tripartite-type tricarboxylate transporter receptor subunit TctC
MTFRPARGRRSALRAAASIAASVAASVAATCLVIAPGLLIPGTASAQNYPNHPIKIVVTFPTGGAPDILARLISSNADLGQPVVVDNRPGAGGNIGAEIVAKAQPDGYNLVMGTVGTHSINGALYAKMPYDMVKDFEPIALIASTPNLLVVNNDLPVKSVKELIDWGKANPNKLSFGSPGIGTSIHVSGELFKTMTGVQMAHVPYKGRQFAIPDLVGGQIQLMFDNMPSALPMVKEGKLRALGQTGAKRSQAAPDIPTVAEQGLAGFEATSWFAMFAPAGTPKDVIARWNGEIKRIFSLPEVGAKLQQLGLDPILSTPQELAAFQAAEIGKWTKVVKESGAKAE